MSLADAKAMKALVAGAAAMASLTMGGEALAQAVVIRSTGPSAAAYPMGRKLPADASVTLKAGDRVTVLDKSGTRVLSGPGTYAMNGTIDRNASTVGGMMAMGGPRVRTRTGAVRGGTTEAPPPPRPDSVWYVDVSKGGTYCVADPSTLVLWRPDRTDAASGKLSAAGKSADVEWSRGNALKLWPEASLPVADGVTYTFTGPGAAGVQIKTRLVGEMPADAMDMASRLAELGCTAQLDVLANAATPAAPTGG